MSFLIATPDIVSTAATDLAGIASNLGAANSAAAASTTGVLPAALDEVSTEIAALFDAHGQAFQALSVRAAAFHEQFVQLLGGGASAYANAEANIVQALTSAAPGSAQGIVPATVLQSIEAAAAGPPHINLGPLNTGTLNLGLGNIGNVNLGSGNIDNLNLGGGNRGSVVNGTTLLGNYNLGSANLGSGNTGFANTGTGNIGIANTGTGNIGFANTGNNNMGIANTGTGNNGLWNTGVSNTGIGWFGNSNTGTMTPLDSG